MKSKSQSSELVKSYLKHQLSTWRASLFYEDEITQRNINYAGNGAL